MVSKTTTVRSIDADQGEGHWVRGYGHLPPCRIARDGIGLVPEGRQVVPIEIASRAITSSSGHISWSGASRKLAAAPMSSADISGFRQHGFG